MNAIRNFTRDESGTTAMKYNAIAACIAVLIMGLIRGVVEYGSQNSVQ